ncbi:CDP-diacylglycerol-phosphatidylglycerol phosphatidyltransferase [Friedmanniella luteola]|uniref:CDP-diacylglycerol-phosphatidylglycerol phosphatidyltransferase n=2 Tax=Friedmanniella luteola TaxID=546871 RepID=A0A1H1TQA3_9ACTN|nr:CDP-diacylglycerol-phosphatidylglycerol phosphatidyltransferase [Friedmanniella luteola]
MVTGDQTGGATRPADDGGLPLPAAGAVGLVGPADGDAPTWDTDRMWTLPNVLSLLRLAGVPLMVWLILGPHHDLLAVVVLAVAGFTDWLDGFLARRWHQTSRVGQMLDPVADRLYILAVVLCLAARAIIPWWLVVLLVARDVMITALVPLLRTRGYSSLPVHFLGKAATFNLLYAFPLILLGADDGLGWAVAGVLGWAFALWGVGLYWWAGLLYLVQTLGLLRDVPARTRAG